MPGRPRGPRPRGLLGAVVRLRLRLRGVAGVPLPQPGPFPAVRAPFLDRPRTHVPVRRETVAARGRGGEVGLACSA